jgi:hypothetical protein
MDTEKIAESLVKSFTGSSGEAEKIAGEIVRLQDEQLDLLDEVGEKIARIGREMNEPEQSLEALLHSNPEAAKVVLGIFRKAKFNTGELSGWTRSALEKAFGAPVYPPAWPVRKSRWSIS